MKVPCIAVDLIPVPQTVVKHENKQKIDIFEQAGRLSSTRKSLGTFHHLYFVCALHNGTIIPRNNPLLQKSMYKYNNLCHFRFRAMILIDMPTPHLPLCLAVICPVSGCVKRKLHTTHTQEYNMHNNT